MACGFDPSKPDLPKRVQINSDYIDGLENGTTKVPEATHAQNADTATNAQNADTATHAQNADEASKALKVKDIASGNYYEIDTSTIAYSGETTLDEIPIFDEVEKKLTKLNMSNVKIPKAIESDTCKKASLYETEKASDPGVSTLEEFRTYFYNLRKGQRRHYQYENIHPMLAYLGYPQYITSDFNGFIYVDIPYTEAGGFEIDIKLMGRNSSPLFTRIMHSTLNSAWQDTNWQNIQDPTYLRYVDGRGLSAFTDGAMFTILEGSIDDRSVVCIHIKDAQGEVRTFSRISTSNAGVVKFSQLYDGEAGATDNFVTIDTNTNQGIYHERPLGGGGGEVVVKSYAINKGNLVSGGNMINEIPDTEEFTFSSGTKAIINTTKFGEIEVKKNINSSSYYSYGIVAPGRLQPVSIELQFLGGFLNIGTSNAVQTAVTEIKVIK